MALEKQVLREQMGLSTPTNASKSRKEGSSPEVMRSRDSLGETISQFLSVIEENKEEVDALVSGLKGVMEGNIRPLSYRC